MTTSVTHFLSKPTGREPIDPASLGYMRQRNRGRVYSAVIDEFEKSGISQTDLACRLHKGTEQISRWLGSPGNWTLDTVSDLFFAISGGEPTYGVQYPLNLLATNETRADLTTSVVYCGAFPHDFSCTSGTVSYAGTANLNPQVTGTTLGFQGASSFPLAVPTGAVYLAAVTSGGSNAFVGQMGSAVPSNGNLTVRCFDSSGCGASAAAGRSLPGLWFAHSGNEFSLSPPTAPTNGYQEIVAVMAPTYQVEEIATVMTPDRVSVLR